MQYLRSVISLLIIISIFFMAGVSVVEVAHAQTCATSRIINQYSCVPRNSTCPDDGGISNCQTAAQVCSVGTNTGEHCSPVRPGDPNPCGTGTCSDWVCEDFCTGSGVNWQCDLTTSTVSCDQSTCSWNGDIRQCSIQSTWDGGSLCSLETENLSYPCGIVNNGGGNEPTPLPGVNTCSGSCFGGLSNCGEVGRPSGSGSCPNAGELCCNSPGSNSGPNNPLNCDVTVIRPSDRYSRTEFAVGESVLVTMRQSSSGGDEMTSVRTYSEDQSVISHNGTITPSNRPNCFDDAEPPGIRKGVSCSSVPSGTAVGPGTTRIHVQMLNGNRVICEAQSAPITVTATSGLINVDNQPNPFTVGLNESITFNTEIQKIDPNIVIDEVLLSRVNGRISIGSSGNSTWPSSGPSTQIDSENWQNTITGRIGSGYGSTGVYVIINTSNPVEQFRYFVPGSLIANTTPVVDIISPDQGNNVTVGDTVPIQAEVIDNNIDRVEFYVDGTLQCTETTPTSGDVYTCNGWVVPDGQENIVIEVIATDEDGETGDDSVEVNAYINLQGGVYRDPGDSYLNVLNGMCESLSGPPYTPYSGGGTVTAVSGGSSVFGNINPGSGLFSMLVPVSSNLQATFNSATPSDICTCPGSTCQFSGLTSPYNSLTFFMTPSFIRDAWWQVIGGNIYSYDRSATLIPVEQCEDEASCSPYASLESGANGEGMIVTTLNTPGSIDTSDESGDQTSNVSANSNAFAKGSEVTGALENYDYFYRVYSMGISPTSDFVNPANAAKPGSAPVNGRAYFADGDMTIANSPWRVTAGESLVVFVNGNLNIEQPNPSEPPIQVEEGGFLAIFVKGNVNMAANVCQADHLSYDPVVEGLFVANGSLVVGEGGDEDCKFVGAGSFIGWSGVSLQRNFGEELTAQEAWNAQSPVEAFIYRPDLIVNMPERMAQPFYAWQEVAP